MIDLERRLTAQWIKDERRAVVVTDRDVEAAFKAFIGGRRKNDLSRRRRFKALEKAVLARDGNECTLCGYGCLDEHMPDLRMAFLRPDIEPPTARTLYTVCSRCIRKAGCAEVLFTRSLANTEQTC